VHLAVEVAREGREGRKIGTLFVVGDVGMCSTSLVCSFSTRWSGITG
jgi:DNA integrity scanning protein DisA with diadenylate cyclase activity